MHPQGIKFLGFQLLCLLRGVKYGSNSLPCTLTTVSTSKVRRSAVHKSGGAGKTTVPCQLCVRGSASWASQPDGFQVRLNTGTDGKKGRWRIKWSSHYSTWSGLVPIILHL